jgi:H/ACA ribonucleoprotein complex subunit 4
MPEPDPRYGCAPEDRAPHQRIERGVVMLDKPAGPSSRQAADRVRSLLGADKAGHGGTLDPRVTGVLPVLLNRSTKVAQVLLGCDKTYAGTMQLHGEVGDEELEEAVERFTGVITQLPPRRSRVKREEREREVYRFEIRGRDGRDARFVVHCEGGTYIRKLIHDLGEDIGCGAHMSELRRTQAAGYQIDECVTTEEVGAAAESAGEERVEALASVLRSVEEVVQRLVPSVILDDGAVNPVASGYPLAVPGVCALDDFEEGEVVGVYTLKGELVGVGEALMGTEQILERGEGEAVHVSQVLMPRGAYPE